MKQLKSHSVSALLNFKNLHFRKSMEESWIKCHENYSSDFCTKILRKGAKKYVSVNRYTWFSGLLKLSVFNSPRRDTDKIWK